MSAASVLTESLRPVVDFIYPPRCPLCGEGIEQQSGLCAECWSGLAIPAEPWCVTCQRPLDQHMSGEGAMCAPCLADPPRHDGIAAATLYNDASRKLVLTYKHGRRIALASLMARLMAARLGPLDEETVLVPVPLHRWRLWRRGFNQAALLAKELAKLTDARLGLDWLERNKSTPSLGGLGRKEREKALAGAITVRESVKGRLKGSPVVLIDDVLTSGATSDACVKALRKAGAASVKIACFARVIDGDTPATNLASENETPEAARTSGAT